MIEITSINNPVVKEINALKTRKGRWTKGLYLVEGYKMITEAIRESGLIVKLIINSDFIDAPETASLISGMEAKTDAIITNSKLFSRLSAMDSPQGVMALIKMKIKTIKEFPGKGRFLFLDGLQDPGNCGTIIRSADAFGFNGLVIGPGSVDPFNPKAVQASMGSILRSSLYFTHDGASDLEKLKAKGYKVASTSMEGSVVLKEYEFTDRDIVIIGNEGCGISKEIFDICDQRITIPMPGKAESLNAGVADSLIMYEASLNSRLSVEF
jgi:TrmH family RNA methyltransferase